MEILLDIKIMFLHEHLEEENLYDLTRKLYSKKTRSI
jgi:hypothetical protein